MTDIIQEIKDKSFNLLSYRERSINELKKRLIKKGYHEKDVCKVITRLKELDYLNDERFAENWIKYRIKHKPRGRNLLKKELMAKGVDQRLINRVLDKLLSEDIEKELAFSLAAKWLRSHSLDIVKLKRYLYNKGFTADIIYKTIESLDF